MIKIETFLFRRKILSNLVFVLLILSLTMNFWVPYVTAVAIVILAIIFTYSAKGRIRNILEKNYLLIFLISLLATIFLAVTHIELVPNHLNQYGKTLGKMIFFAIFITTVDVVAYQFKKFEIDAVKFARTCIWALAFSIISKILFVYIVTMPLSAMQILLGVNNDAFLSNGLNPNRADDLFLIHVAILVFCMSIMIINKKIEWITFTIAFCLIFYLLVSFYVTGSRSGHIGFIIGAAFIFLLAFKTAKRSMLIVSILFITMASILMLSNPKFFKDEQSISDNNLQVNSKEKHLALNLVNQDADILRNLKRSYILENCIPFLKEKHKLDFPYVDFSTGLRLALWNDGFQIWKQRIYFGHGEYDHVKLVKTYNFLSRCHILSFSHIHSFYLDLLIRGGLLMLFCYISIFIILYYMMLKASYLDNKFSALSYVPVFYFTYILVENLFDLTFIYNTDLYGFALSYAVICGLFFALSDDQKDNIITYEK